MTDEQIEQLAQRVAKLILNELHKGLLLDLEPDAEEELLAELAKSMTLLDKHLKAEDYEKCDLLQKKRVCKTSNKFIQPRMYVASKI